MLNRKLAEQIEAILAATEQQRPIKERIKEVVDLYHQMQGLHVWEVVGSHQYTLAGVEYHAVVCAFFTSTVDPEGVTHHQCCTHCDLVVRRGESFEVLTPDEESR